MSQTVVREPKDIQAEYASLCAQSGEKTFQILILQKDVRKINARIKALNVEMGEAVKAAQAAQQAAVTTEVPSEQPSGTN